MNLLRHTDEVNTSGFSILSDIYTQEEIEKIIDVIDDADISGDKFRKSANLFAIRQFLRRFLMYRHIFSMHSLKRLLRLFSAEIISS